MSFKDETTGVDVCVCPACTLRRMIEKEKGKPANIAEESADKNKGNQIPIEVKKLILLIMIDSIINKK